MKNALASVNTITETDPVQASGWRAGLQLQFCYKKTRTVLQSAEHFGPLRVQRPFYPEGAVCHIYLLHPPGGMVAGDSLVISVDLEEGAHALMTTPAAGKLYRVNEQALPQYQGVKASIESGSVLEWLPQETIIFNGARGELLNRFDLASDASLIGWDIVCLGRRASGETFDKGSLKQRIEIYRNGKPVFIDRVHFEGGSAMLAAPWGMNRASVSGTLFVTLGERCNPSLDELRATLNIENLEHPSAEWGVSRRGEILLIRYMGDSAESCRRGFEKCWQLLRPLLLSMPVHRPRIWNT